LEKTGPVYGPNEQETEAKAYWNPDQKNYPVFPVYVARSEKNKNDPHNRDGYPNYNGKPTHTFGGFVLKVELYGIDTSPGKRRSTGVNRKGRIYPVVTGDTRGRGF